MKPSQPRIHRTEKNNNSVTAVNGIIMLDRPDGSYTITVYESVGSSFHVDANVNVIPDKHSLISNNVEDRKTFKVSIGSSTLRFTYYGSTDTYDVSIETPDMTITGSDISAAVLQTLLTRHNTNKI